MIEVYNIGELKELTAWLEQYVKPRLGSDERQQQPDEQAPGSHHARGAIVLPTAES